jgi:hypothetical protein
MAYIVASAGAHWRQSVQHELETLSYVAEQLPDNYTVYNGVHWTRIEKSVSPYDEIDLSRVGT